MAIDVKSPNKSVGKKLESIRIQKPAEIVVAVSNIALPVVLCAFFNA